MRFLPFLLCLASISPAWAAEDPSPPSTTVDYRWQLLAVDAASVGLIALGSSRDNEAARWSGVAGFAFAAPAIEVIHGEHEHGLASLALHTTLPMFAAFAGLLLQPQGCWDDEGHKDPGLCPMEVGLVVGAGAAVAIDCIALGRVERAAPTPSAPRVHPLLSATATGGSVGLGG